MNKNMIIALIVGLVLLAGGAFFIFGGSDDSGEEASVSTNQSSDSSSGDSSGSSSDTFNPVNTTQQAFTATVTTTTAEGTFTGEIKHSGDDTWQYRGENNGEEFEAIITPDSFYTYGNGQWFKLPVEQSTELGLDTEDFEVTDEELLEFQSILSSKGDADCPAGTCTLWEAEEYEGNEMLQFYVSNSDNKISKLVSESSDGKIEIVYTYDDVTIKIPANAQELPTL